MTFCIDSQVETDIAEWLINNHKAVDVTHHFLSPPSDSWTRTNVPALGKLFVCVLKYDSGNEYAAIAFSDAELKRLQQLPEVLGLTEEREVSRRWLMMGTIDASEISDVFRHYLQQQGLDEGVVL